MTPISTSQRHWRKETEFVVFPSDTEDEQHQHNSGGDSSANKWVTSSWLPCQLPLWWRQANKNARHHYSTWNPSGNYSSQSYLVLFLTNTVYFGVYFVYSSALLVAQQRRITGWLVYNELERMYNKTVVTRCQGVSRHTPRGTKENRRESWYLVFRQRVDRALSEIQVTNFTARVYLPGLTGWRIYRVIEKECRD